MSGHERVAVTVGWVFEDTYDICFAGIQDGTLLIISTLGVCNDLSRETFLNGYREMRRRFSHSKIICMGNKLPEFDTMKTVYQVFLLFYCILKFYSF